MTKRDNRRSTEILTMAEYQSEVMRIAIDVVGDEALLYAAMLIAGEAGEYLNIVKKLVYHGHEAGDEAKAAIIDELGDILSGVAYAAAILSVPLVTVAERNVDKLRRRYPNGFSRERSRNRKS